VDLRVGLEILKHEHLFAEPDAGDNRRGPLQFYDQGFSTCYFVAEPGLPADVSAFSFGVKAELTGRAIGVVLSLRPWRHSREADFVHHAEDATGAKRSWRRSDQAGRRGG
jgi:hypothetical protein